MRIFIYKNFYFLVKLYHACLAFLGALIYNFPSRKIYVVGVTGTKGKSSTIEIMAAILEAVGKKVAVSSSVRNDGSSMTMPGRFFLQKFLRQAVNNNCDYALIEVTSQGVLQNRHRFIKWDAGIFTNLSPEHVEFHGGFEKYREAKLDFFRYIARSHLDYAGTGERSQKRFFAGAQNDKGDQEGVFKVVNPKFFINKNDENTKYFIDAISSCWSLRAERGNLSSKKEIASSQAPRNDGENQKIILYEKSDLPNQLAGEFNKYNIGAAVAFARSQNISEEIIAKAVVEFSGVPGRMEFLQREPFAVVIDYAHTPDSLRKVYETLQNQELGIKNQGKLICVLGCAGGGRDKWKRPEMGKIAAEFCDEIILTNEDPYDENSLTILKEIESGFSQFKIILDRKEAIKKALALARAGDIVIITGKGSEKWTHLAQGQKIPWNEKETVLDLLKDLN